MRESEKSKNLFRSDLRAEMMNDLMPSFFAGFNFVGKSLRNSHHPKFVSASEG